MGFLMGRKQKRGSKPRFLSINGGGIEPHRLLPAPLALSANVFASLPRSQFTVNGSKMSTVLST